MFHITLIRDSSVNHDQSTGFLNSLKVAEIAVISFETISPINAESVRAELERSLNKLYVESVRESRPQNIAIVIRILPHDYSVTSLKRFLKNVIFHPKTFRRFPAAQKLLLQVSEKLSLHILEMNHSRIGTPLSSDAVKQLRQIELSSIVRETGCILEAPNGCSFRLMSKILGRQFLRVGNFQRSIQNLFAFYFWFRPTVAHFSHLIADTWTISTFLQFVQYQERVKFKRTLRIAYLQSHILDEETKARRVIEILVRSGFKDSDKLLLVWSAVSSGRSIDKMLQLLDLQYSSLRDVTETFVLMYKAESDQIDFFARNPDTSFFPVLPADTEYLTDRIIEIDPKGFYPAVQTRYQKKLLVTNCSADKPFFEKYAGVEAFSVHRDGRSGRHVHHAFHVDFEKISSTEMFQSKVDQTLEQFGKRKFDLVLSADKSNNRKFVTLLQNSLDISRIEFIPLVDLRSTNQLMLRKILKDLVETTVGRPSVLVVEAIAISGQDLSQFTQAWRAAEVELSVYHLIGILRTSSELTAREKLKMLSYPNGRGSESFAYAVERVVLPNWGREHCPWCKELSLLQKIETVSIPSAATSKHIKWRRAVLEDRTGNRSRVLHGAEHIDDIMAFGRTSGSFFFDTASTPDKKYFDADWVLSVASILQRWRTEPQEAQELLIDPGTVTDKNKYNDPFLRASIIRCLQPEELMYQTGEDRNHFIAFIAEGSNFKDSENPYFHLGREVVLGFGEMYQNLDLSSHLDEVSEILCKAKLGRL